MRLTPLCVCVPNPSDGRARAAGGRQFDIVVVAQDFHGVKPIQRHRMVHHCLENLLADDSIHSVKIKVGGLPTTHDTIESTQITRTTTLLTKPNQAMTPKQWDMVASDNDNNRGRQTRTQGSVETPPVQRQLLGSCSDGVCACGETSRVVEF